MQQKPIEKPQTSLIHSVFLKWAPALKVTILLLIMINATIVRVFSVIRFESIIHEFDPWFNYRTTQYLSREGLFGLWNSIFLGFDSESWYPLGRSVGGTVYPGLMSTSAIIYWTLHKLSFPVDIRNVCVFLAPVFASFTSLAAYLMTKEVTKKTEAGLFAALFIGIIPSYMSRSVAGSYDNEGVSIFALVFCFYMFLKSVNTGSIMWSTFCVLSYFYMVSAWGGYAFIINIIPIFVLFQFISGKFSQRLYVSYSIFYIMGTFYAMLIPFVGFQALHSSEHMASHGIYYLFQWIKKYISQEGFEKLQKMLLIVLISAIVIGFLFLTFTGKTQWSGRSMTLLDPTYAKKYIPIIASVSEHQATAWTSFFHDLYFPLMLAPAGLYYCYKKGTDGMIFAALYVVLAVYFAGVMVRLLLVLAPAVSVIGGIGLSKTIHYFRKSFISSNKPRVLCLVSFTVIIFLSFLVSQYCFYGNITAADTYSSPSVVMSSRDRFGNRRLIDDYREAYYWLRTNTRESDKIMSWWDYGYQITGMGNRTVLVDNNTWNNTHIATVGMAMSSPEDDAFEVCQKLDVDYVLVIFGGYSWYSGDDINKFLWMVRIGGGVYPHIKEDEYYANGQYRIDKGASKTMLDSLMYRLSFYRFDEVQTQPNRPAGFDNVRQAEMGLKGYKLENFEEAFTSEHWIVRIYRVKPRGNRADAAIQYSRNKQLYSQVIKQQEVQEVLASGKYAKKIHPIKKKLDA